MVSAMTTEFDREAALETAIFNLREACHAKGVDMRKLEAVVRASNNLIGTLYDERRVLRNVITEYRRQENRDTNYYDTHSELGLLK